MTIDPAHGCGFPGHNLNPSAPSTEYTSWTNLSDLNRSRLLVRGYTSFNYTSFDLKALSDKNELLVAMLSDLPSMGGDGAAAMAPLKAG
ncbi:hypothetical protein [Mycolicibacterium brumae]|uniref:Uncharacterized protein n=1 Tax=Mycolicibacterium brumae TaxID=85968 RepID=A0A2G5P5D8_9MYCO|nr:hypothetical protein [Mycolicibacterium brumae]MCV7192200.1 hypothetical protein [Mycolicibacterium brumae]PIB73578.1 hypothetical protein CQY22_016195 [Mycolicibacterium brumae]UWW07025.1 hypothetical protein L2Z93_000011 [Mycolicibacterium brumae]